MFSRWAVNKYVNSYQTIQDFVQMCKHSSDLQYSQSRALIVVVFGFLYPIFIIQSSEDRCPQVDRDTLNAKCSKKWAVPLVLSVSALEPASIQTPTVEVCAHGECSVAICRVLISLKALCYYRILTVSPLDKVVLSVLML